MEVRDFGKMDNPAAAFYLLALAEALAGMTGGVFMGRVPQEVQKHTEMLVEYFRAQLPEDGFSVAPSDWLE